MADALVLGKRLSKLVPFDLCLQRWGCHMENEFQVVGMERQKVRRERHSVWNSTRWMLGPQAPGAPWSKMIMGLVSNAEECRPHPADNRKPSAGLRDDEILISEK